MMGNESATRRLCQAITDVLEARGITEHVGPPFADFTMVREDGSVQIIAYRVLVRAAVTAELKSELYPNRPLLWRTPPECEEVRGIWRAYLRFAQLPEDTKTLTIRWPL